jgi:CRP-like cAMP-binding protein
VTPTNRVRQVYHNRVLASLPKREIDRLAPHLLPLQFKQNDPLAGSGEREPYAYFLEEGMASIVTTLTNGSTVEVGVVGQDGVVGIPALLGTRSMPLKTFIQIAGSGFRIKADRLKEAFERPGKLRAGLQRYLQSQFVQVAQSSACNRFHPAEQRLARWILTCQDKTGSDYLPLKQEFLGQMLGTTRSTVTLAAVLLQEDGLIGYARGKITVRNHAGLERVACECYRIVRNESRRLAAS